MNNNVTPALAAVLAATLLISNAHAESGWVEIDASEPFTDRNGVKRTPMCSGGPELITAGASTIPVIADANFSFFFRAGDPRKLAIVWDGGGACWDANTCIGSALAGEPIYSLTVDETVKELNAAEGLGDRDNPANPVGNYTQVLIPYCTADTHLGGTDKTYYLDNPGGQPIPWTIHHRGYDNVVAVLEWLANYYNSEVGRAPSRVFLSGASAGGYGVMYAYPAVQRMLPRRTRVRTLVDAANGVINQDFYDRALTPNGAWNVWQNLAPELAGAFASGPDEIWIETLKSLGANFPRGRFGQYTTAFDDTQIFFFNVARNVNNPELWTDPAQIVFSGLEWTFRARAYMVLTALQTWNYRFYLAKGTDHTIIADNKFYTEDTARGVYFSDWVDDMSNRFFPFGGDWRNVSCAPDCLP